MSVDKKISYDVQGGIRNYLGKQKTISNVPLKWKSGPGHPKTELAYITKKEKDLLIKKDLHNSLKNGPNKGPGGIISLNNDGIGDIGGPGNISPGGPPGGGNPDMTYTAPKAPPAKPPQGGDKPPTTNFPPSSIHGGPTFKGPPKVPDMIGPSYVPGVTYNTGLETQRLKNIELNNQLLNTPYRFKSKIPSVNFIGNTLGRLAYNVNTKFFSDKNIGAKINPETGEPFGYGIDGYNDYMKQRTLGNVGAYGGTELSQNAINARAAQGDSTQGIMDVYTDDGTDDGTGDGDGTGDTSDDELILRFLGADSTLDPLAAGLASTDELRAMLLERAKNLYTT